MLRRHRLYCGAISISSTRIKSCLRTVLFLFCATLAFLTLCSSISISIASNAKTATSSSLSSSPPPPTEPAAATAATTAAVNVVEPISTSSAPLSFGFLLGAFDGVAAYSNHFMNGANMTWEANFADGVYTGVKWQCVEYARRYLQVTKGVTFSSVDSAFQIPTLGKFTTLNGYDVHVTDDLEVGSIVVWPQDFEPDSPDGHVAVVTSIKVNGIRVAEQNYDDATFPRFVPWSDLKLATIINVPDYHVFKIDKKDRKAQLKKTLKAL